MRWDGMRSQTSQGQHTRSAEAVVQSKGKAEEEEEVCGCVRCDLDLGHWALSKVLIAGVETC